MPRECIHELVRCTICEPTIEPTLRRSTFPDSAPFRARFDGRCQVCDFDVVEGDRVRYVNDQLVHTGCADG